MLISSAKAQGNKISIAPCLPANADLIRLEGVDEWGYAWVNVVKDILAFYALEGEPIEWRGYAPKGQEYKEWQGVEYGFGGVDMRLYEDTFYIYLYSADATFAKREIIGRIEAHSYGEYVILFFTRLYSNTDSASEHMGYHVYADPRNNGEACMYWINRDDFNEVMGWK